MIKISGKANENHVLMTGFHFPPSSSSSGHLRLLGFTRYLPEFGWRPIVLTASVCAHPVTDQGSADLIPAGCLVYRAFALDARRHFGIRGRYPAIFAQPDRWASWWPAAVWTGLRLIRKYRVKAIWSTYPIMTSHCVAYALSYLSGLPWIADFRDPVRDSVNSQNELTVRTQLHWEKRVLSRAACSVFTTSGALELYAGHYPDAARRGRLVVIPNGYDEVDFKTLERNMENEAPGTDIGPIHLIHSGSLYPNGRNAVPFLEALRNLICRGELREGDVKVTLRASGAERYYKEAIMRLRLSHDVRLAPLLPYREALRELSEAAGLLLFQGEAFDRQIPAKVYEYARIGRPIFAMVGERGNTAEMLRSIKNAIISPAECVPVVEARLMEFVRALREGTLPRRDVESVKRYSRRSASTKLAMLMDRTVQGGVVTRP